MVATAVGECPDAHIEALGASMHRRLIIRLDLHGAIAKLRSYPTVEALPGSSFGEALVSSCAQRARAGNPKLEGQLALIGWPIFWSIEPVLLDIDAASTRAHHLLAKKIAEKIGAPDYGLDRPAGGEWFLSAIREYIAWSAVWIRRVDDGH